MKKDGIRKYLENLSFVTQILDTKFESLEYKIFQCLVGTSRSSRLGPFPSDDIIKTICDNIRENVKNKEPIRVVSAWGGKKTLPGIKQEVDIAEYFAMLQYLAIAKEVQSIYPPGLQYNIFLGDAYYKYLYGNNPGVDNYRSRMKDILKIFDMECFNLFSLDEFHRKNDNLLNRCDLNYNLLLEYWEESSNFPEEDWKKLSSYRKLCENGWIGIIPSIMREYYLKRLDNLFPDFSYKEKVLSVIKFFAYGMMVSQNDLFGRKNSSSCTADFCFLRIPPPGMPKSLHENRLRKRILPVKFSNKTAPPWAVEGGLIFDGSSYKPTLVSHFSEIASFKKEIVSIELFGEFNMDIKLLS